MIVGITGFIGSGKSTVARHLQDKHDFRIIKFAGPLKQMCRAVGMGEAHIEGNLKGEPQNFLCGKTPRQFMQLLGTEFGRDMIGANFWTGLWEYAVCTSPYNVVCDDVRFPNELAVVKKLGGITLRVERNEAVQTAHASESHVLPADFAINNNHSIDKTLRDVEKTLGLK